MRWAAAFVLALAATAAYPQRLLLIPIDNRPAPGQFAQMIGRIAGSEVRLPPYGSLGQFTQAGAPDQVLDWLENVDYDQVGAVIVSTDMVAYGGLIASRRNDASYERAIGRLRRLATIRRKHPEVKFYAFSAITRILPTATRAASRWRIQLGKYVQLRERARLGKTAQIAADMARLRASVPRNELKRYDQMRLRNLRIQRDLLRMTATGVFDYLMLGQDDAAPDGPHVRETARLRSDTSELGVQSKVYFCEGIDQHSNVLVSRALLRHSGFVPRVKIVYSDEAGKKVYANYESKPLQNSVSDQLFASGARPATEEDGCDYVLFLNTPKPRQDRFDDFVERLGTAIDSGEPVAVADVNLTYRAAADPRLYAALTKNHRAPKLLSYAGWNTAGNTVGTAIPAANMAVLARLQGAGVACEVAREEFLLHRLVNDFAYHTYTRPAAYSLIAGLGQSGSRDEIYGENYTVVGSFVKRNLRGYLDDLFKEQFEGQTVEAKDEKLTIDRLERVSIWLPWPRAYEVRIEFKLGTN